MTSENTTGVSQSSNTELKELLKKKKKSRLPLMYGTPSLKLFKKTRSFPNLNPDFKGSESHTRNHSKIVIVPAPALQKIKMQGGKEARVMQLCD